MKLQGRKDTKVWTHFIIGLVIEVADAYDTQQVASTGTIAFLQAEEAHCGK